MSSATYKAAPYSLLTHWYTHPSVWGGGPNLGGGGGTLFDVEIFMAMAAPSLGPSYEKEREERGEMLAELIYDPHHRPHRLAQRPPECADSWPAGVAEYSDRWSVHCLRANPPTWASICRPYYLLFCGLMNSFPCDLHRISWSRGGRQLDAWNFNQNAFYFIVNNSFNYYWNFIKLYTVR